MIKERQASPIPIEYIARTNKMCLVSLIPEEMAVNKELQSTNLSYYIRRILYLNMIVP